MDVLYQVKNVPLLLGVFNHEMLGFVNAFLHLLICSCSFSLDVDVVGYVNCFPEKLFIWLCWVLVVVHVVFDLCCSMRIFSCGIRALSCNMWTLSCSMWDLVPWPGIKPSPPGLGAWSLSHWTTREVYFSDVESASHTWDKSHLEVVYNYFCLLLSLIC